MADGESPRNKTNQQSWEWALLLGSVAGMVLLILSSSWPLASLLPTGAIFVLAIVIVWMVRSLREHERKWDAIVST